MINALKGMKDLLDKDAYYYKKVIKICEEVAKNYGFTFINTPHLELCTLFKRSVGESSDIVGKEMYEFIDKGENHVCMRPEGTAGVVRAYIEKKLDKNTSVKRWFYYGSMFRYERPQKGRLREFHQFGVESLGIPNVYEDASIILMLVEIFSRLGIDFKLQLNSLGCSQCLPKYRDRLVEFLDSKEGFCEDCLRRKNLNPIRVLDCKNEHCQNLLENAPLLINNLCTSCQKDFETLQQILKDNGVKFELDSKLVRGLDYYSKTAFEFISDEIGAKAAIAGGGRYDRLIEYLGGKSGYGIGFAMGIERIITILEQKEEKIQREGIYLCAMDEIYIQKLLHIATNLRKEYKVLLSYEARKLAKHLENADKNNTEIFLCMGENEAQNESLFYKNLAKKEEKMIKISDLKKVL
ncbi:histidine--tRNA ligase [Campylobacter jejuni]|uniref:histidine--tRNA ligase n=1 Tax=Campylobacter jejuni TaxID=197 RepID=UPI00069AB8A4|nr:histidine--tRNA ligase [Campylobacter jejuni]EAJ1133924.1 histidine--tRNA ligase [Campylobacter jejuni]EAJ7128408.1 histidine--tRNA ligase [Campylobacter jejuni]EAK7100686.1 histidine--tRNA ligase [Campylobacter jejuni]EAL4167785.1 histidine--tRNA ligase [Campylobacter jejuni]ECL3371746.1 histidine--tRNA ligase [Campylobacter jejuni]